MQDEAATSFRLSPQQELAWSAQPDGPVGGAQMALQLTGELDGERLRAALDHVVERHEILRTTFRRRPGMKTPLQVVNPALPSSGATSTFARSTSLSRSAASRKWQ